MKPFLKWPGGKRWFVEKHSTLLPTNFNTYIEPFLGSGSVFFFLQPIRAILSDVNKDLIDTFKGVKDSYDDVLRKLQHYQTEHSEEFYYNTRAELLTNTIDVAARFIYLNRTCFNGIYRVNNNGVFNVPKGTSDSVFRKEDDFKSWSRLLSTARLEVCDFEITIDKAMAEDLIFADPPYTVRHNLNGFREYNEKLFSWDDQVRLSEALIRARDRGAHIVSTNANHQSVRELYENRGFTLLTTSRFSSISANPTNRRQFDELVILSSESFL
ncbi:Dam family site-specific DNA-(adenine-N6)-methyltransferase [Larkinella knui]|uniref:Site-specific DNA-methyltransferase (adenine-specific) n=1 Tax=Larkinella knui TaxID=2025310 RepID=A0A3P1CRC5_9BACT|nr:Dam family site-specific DNA-(adenine-N6)-methyltransferase [Larkinella knui]